MARPELDAAVTAAGRSVLDQVGNVVYLTWSRLDDLSDEAGERAVAQVLPTVGAGQNMMSALQASYVSQVTGILIGAPVVATLVSEAPWTRSPLIQARRLVGEGEDVPAALDLAARRARQVHSGDVLRARNDAASALGHGVEPYRGIRWASVPGPSACAWCREIATKLYYRPDGLPRHLNDHCGLSAVTAAEGAGYTNASTAFDNYRWRSRVKTADVADVQRRTATEADRLAAEAYDRMVSMAA